MYNFSLQTSRASDAWKNPLLNRYSNGRIKEIRNPKEEGWAKGDIILEATSESTSLSGRFLIPWSFAFWRMYNNPDE
jgi:hypothetical protein